MPTIDDFQLEQGHVPLIEKTFEEMILEGESDDDKLKSLVLISIRSFPLWLSQTLNHSGRKTKPKPISASCVQRVTVKLGLAVIRIQYGEYIEQVASLRNQVYELGDQFLLKRSFRGCDYRLQETVSDIRSKCSLREWTAGAITEQLVDQLGLPFSTATLLTLIAGVSTSTAWVPRQWVKLANKELAYFQQYLETEAKRLKTEVLEK